MSCYPPANTFQTEGGYGNAELNAAQPYAHHLPASLIKDKSGMQQRPPCDTAGTQYRLNQEGITPVRMRKTILGPWERRNVLFTGTAKSLPDRVSLRTARFGQRDAPTCLNLNAF